MGGLERLVDMPLSAPIPSFLLELTVDEATFMFAGISLQIVLCIGIAHLPPKGAYLYYWLNPLLALSSVMSPLPALEHMLIVCLPFFVCDLPVMSMDKVVQRGGHKVLQCILAMYILQCFDYNYLLLAPFLMAMMGANSNAEDQEGKQRDKPFSLLKNQIFLSLLCLTLLILGGSIYDVRGFSRSFQETYSPSAGLYWYFEAQLFPEFRSYFVPLVSMQPSLFSILLLPLYCLLPASATPSSVIDNEGSSPGRKEEEAIPRRQLLGYHLMVLVVLLFKPAMSLVDVAFGVSLLLTYHRQALRGMRFKAWILTGILVPSVLSPILADAWAEKGTGNANFLFFQSLVLWFFSALGVVEAVKASGGSVLAHSSGSISPDKTKIE